MRVSIYACEDMYHGLHGIEDIGVVEVATIQEADDWGREMSEGVLESFGMEDEYEDEGNWYNDIGEALEWYVYHINEDVAKDISTEELDRIANSLGREVFIKEFCNGEVHE